MVLGFLALPSACMASTCDLKPEKLKYIAFDHSLSDSTLWPLHVRLCRGVGE